ncbi:Alpha-1-antichymotrypsin [Myotis brandtii]|uniref:Alpha-1-antichymotrypsin n=1 Tax=Myotis brandtii TaxID=109478 RepID=S7P1U3_MYOBR|nr:Alpha-1-antichymotrypsin [Myotis brandtii]
MTLSGCGVNRKPTPPSGPVWGKEGPCLQPSDRDPEHTWWRALSADFRDAPAAQRLINDYVREKTQGKLVDLVGDLDAGTAMVLVSYTFFKAKWKTPFDPNDTFQSKFYVGQGRWVTVPMMRSEYLKTPCFRDEALACWVVELGPMELHLPKFSLSSLYHLEGVLPRLGMRKVFSKKADLSGITGDKNLVVSQSPWLKACPLSFVTGKCGERSCPVPLPGGTGQRQEVVDTALGRL